jgi:FkbM family methyltransferase
VHCFEPCSQVFRELSANIGRWTEDPRLAPIQAHQVALSRTSGNADLHLPASFGANRGTASLEAVPSDGPSICVERTEVARLDEILGMPENVGIAKIDVEGHELAVLEGATALLASRRIRDIVFEEHGHYPTPVQSLLQSCGYTVYRLSRSFSRPLLLPASDTQRWDEHPIGVLPNFLATLEPKRAQLRFSPTGWRALSARNDKPWTYFRRFVICFLRHDLMTKILDHFLDFSVWDGIAPEVQRRSCRNVTNGLRYLQAL